MPHTALHNVVIGTVVTSTHFSKVKNSLIIWRAFWCMLIRHGEPSFPDCNSAIDFSATHWKRSFRQTFFVDQINSAFFPFTIIHLKTSKFKRECYIRANKAKLISIKDLTKITIIKLWLQCYRPLFENPTRDSGYILRV